MKVTSGVETDLQKPGYHSATEEDKIAPLYIMTLHFLAYIRQKRIIVYSVLCMYASHRKISVKQRYVEKKQYKNIALDADNVFAKIGDVQKTAILLFAEYITPVRDNRASYPI